MSNSTAKQTTSKKRTDDIKNKSSANKTTIDEQIVTTKNTCRKGKRVDEDMRKTILHEHNVNGLSQKLIAEMFDISQTTISRIIKKQATVNGDTTKSLINSKTTNEDKGFTLIKTNEMIGTSDSSTSKVLKEPSVGTEDNHRTYIDEKDIDEKMRNLILHKYVVNDLTLNEIADIVGTSISNVSKVLIKFRENGVLDSIDGIQTKSKVTKEDKLELVRKWKHNTSQSMSELHASMSNPISKSTFYRIVKELNIFS